MEYASFKDWLESNIVGRFTEEIETKIWDLYSEGKTTELYNELNKLGFQGKVDYAYQTFLPRTRLPY